MTFTQRAMKDPDAALRELEREMNDPRNAHDYGLQEHHTRLWHMVRNMQRARGKGHD